MLQSSDLTVEQMKVRLERCLRNLLLDVVVLSLFRMMPLQCTVRQVAIMDYSQAHVGYDFSDGHVPAALAELRKPWCPTAMANPIVVD